MSFGGLCHQNLFRSLFYDNNIMSYLCSIISVYFKLGDFSYHSEDGLEILWRDSDWKRERERESMSWNEWRIQDGEIERSYGAICCYVCGHATMLNYPLLLPLLNRYTFVLTCAYDTNFIQESSWRIYTNASVTGAAIVNCDNDASLKGILIVPC